MVIPENYKKVLKHFVEKNSNQEVALFAILKMDELVDKWSIILSVNWIDSNNQREIFTSIINTLQEDLSPEELNEIARIAFYNPDDNLVKLFFEKFEEGQYIKEDAKVNGNIVHEGYIISLNKGAIANQASLGL